MGSRIVTVVSAIAVAAFVVGCDHSPSPAAVDAAVSTLEWQLTCQTDPAPSSVIRTVVKAGVLVDANNRANGTATYKPTAPLRLFDRNVVLIRSSPIQPIGAVQSTQPAVTGTVPAPFIAAVLEGSPKGLPYNLHRIEGPYGQPIGSWSTVGSANPAAQSTQTLVTCHSTDGGKTTEAITAEVSLGFRYLDFVRNAMDTYYRTNGEFPTSNAKAGIGNPTSMSGTYIQSLSIGSAPGAVLITFRARLPVAPTIQGKRIVFVARADAGAVRWQCAESLTTVPPKYLVSGCAKLKKETLSAASRSIQPPPKPKSADDTSGWGKYLSWLLSHHMQGMTASRPYPYLVPAGNDAVARAQRQRQLKAVTSIVLRGVVPGNLLAFGGADSSATADLVVKAFAQASPDSMKGVIIVFIGDAVASLRVKQAVEPSGATYRFVPI